MESKETSKIILNVKTTALHNDLLAVLQPWVVRFNYGHKYI